MVEEEAVDEAAGEPAREGAREGRRRLGRERRLVRRVRACLRRAEERRAELHGAGARGEDGCDGRPVAEAARRDQR